MHSTSLVYVRLSDISMHHGTTRGYIGFSFLSMIWFLPHGWNTSTLGSGICPFSHTPNSLLNHETCFISFLCLFFSFFMFSSLLCSAIHVPEKIVILYVYGTNKTFEHKINIYKQSTKCFKLYFVKIICWEWPFGAVNLSRW